MPSCQLRRGDVAYLRIKADVEFAPAAKRLIAFYQRKEDFACLPDAVLISLPAAIVTHFQARAF